MTNVGGKKKVVGKKNKQGMETEKYTFYTYTYTYNTEKSYFNTVCTSLLGILYQVKGAPYVETMPLCPPVCL